MNNTNSSFSRACLSLVSQLSTQTPVTHDNSQCVYYLASGWYSHGVAVCCVLYKQMLSHNPHYICNYQSDCIIIVSIGGGGGSRSFSHTIIIIIIDNKLIN